MFSRYLIFYMFSIKELARIEKARAQLQVDYVSMYLFYFFYLFICLFFQCMFFSTFFPCILFSISR